MGSASSRASHSIHSSRRGFILALLRINGHATSPTPFTHEVSQASKVICDILEHIFCMLIPPDDPRKGATQLATVAKVNRHWHKVAERILYLSVGLTTPTQALLFTRTLEVYPTHRAQLKALSIPRPLRPEPCRTHNAAGMKLSKEQVDRERYRAQAQLSAALLKMLASLHSLSRLEIHSRSIPLLVYKPEGPVHPPPLDNLTLTLHHLTLLDGHDGRWLFLLKYTTNLHSFSAEPYWHASDDSALPFAHWRGLDKLVLHDGMRITAEHFSQLVGVSEGGRPRLTDLALSYIPTDVHHLLPSHLAFLGPTLRRLKFHARLADSDVDRGLADVFRNVLPQMTALVHLDTNVHFVPSSSSSSSSSSSQPFLPPNIQSISLSLALTPNTSTRKIGTIYKTITSILSSFPLSPTTCPLKELKIIDAPVEDYLHFHLAGSNDYGDETEAGKQNRLWMTAARMGVIVLVEKFHDRRGYGARSPSPTPTTTTTALEMPPLSPTWVNE